MHPSFASFETLTKKDFPVSGRLHRVGVEEEDHAPHLIAGVEKWFTDLPRVRIAMEAGTHSIWVSEQIQELGHEVIVANVRELRSISHNDRKRDQADAEKLAATPGSIRRSCGRSPIAPLR